MKNHMKMNEWKVILMINLIKNQDEIVNDQETTKDPSNNNIKKKHLVLMKQTRLFLIVTKTSKTEKP